MHLILVGYSADATRRSLALCRRTFRDLAVDRQVLVWNGAGDAGPAPDGWELVRGSNRLAEFSGWQEGIEHLGREADPRPILFLNDTFGTHRHPSYVRRWALRQALKAAAPSSLVGFMDQTVPPPGRLALCGLPLQQWLSSYCFLMPPALLDRLGGRIFDLLEVSGCVAGGIDEEHFFSDRVSPDLQRYLRWWLFQGWYRSAPLASDNAAVFSLKARCICAELLLSARAQSFGFELRDVMRHHRLAVALDGIHERLVAAARVLRGV